MNEPVACDLVWVPQWWSNKKRYIVVITNIQCPCDDNALSGWDPDVLGMKCGGY